MFIGFFQDFLLEYYWLKIKDMIKLILSVFFSYLSLFLKKCQKYRVDTGLFFFFSYKCCSI